MLVGSPGDGEFGFSLNPLHYAKKGVVAAGHGIATGAKYAGRGVKTVALTAIKPFEWLGSKITAPVRHRVQTLKNRRAYKLAWDNRKSKTPTPAEHAQAKSWTKSHLKSQGPHGKVLALFAGAHPAIDVVPGVGLLGDPVTLTTIAASVPILVAIMNSVIGKANNPREAPANPAADAAAAAVAPDAPVDSAPAQDAAAAVTDAAGDALSPGTIKLPGIGRVKRSHLMVGGGILAGLVVLVLLTNKKG